MKYTSLFIKMQNNSKITNYIYSKLLILYGAHGERKTLYYYVCRLRCKWLPSQTFKTYT